VRRLTRPLARLGIPLPASAIGFRTTDEAIAYANAHPRSPVGDLRHIEQLFEPAGHTREIA
jgi:hypothetical protein